MQRRPIPGRRHSPPLGLPLRTPNPRRPRPPRRINRRRRRSRNKITMGGPLIPDHRVRAAVVALVVASGMSLTMLVGRAVVVRQVQLGFYVWNLFLAWLPLLFALRVYQLAGTQPVRWRALAMSGLLWFLFFPNSAYIVTDFLH